MHLLDACYLQRKQQVAFLLSQPENVRFPPVLHAAVLNGCLQRVQVGAHHLAAVRGATGRGRALQPPQPESPGSPDAGPRRNRAKRPAGEIPPCPRPREDSPQTLPWETAVIGLTASSSRSSDGRSYALEALTGEKASQLAMTAT